jgi:hypothetical protein
VSPLDRALPVAVAVLILWGVATFGAVHDWSRNTLFIAATVAAISMAVRLARQDIPALLLAAALTLVIATQLLPFPPGFTEALTDRTKVAKQYEVSLPSAGRPISIAPDSTALALSATAVFGFFVVALGAQLRSSPAALATLARLLSGIAVAIAVEGLAQKAIFNGKIYWFWESASKASGNYFGPFINRNHFAGWMILAVGICAGRIGGNIAVARHGSKRSRRASILWWSTPEASTIAISAAMLLVMLVSIAFSMSRSGIFGAFITMVIIVATALARPGSVGRRLAIAATISVLACAGIEIRGVDRLATWYATTDTLLWRFHQWQDTMAPLRDFWLVGSGLNTYGVLSLVYPQTDSTVHAAQAHNDYLQLAVEGGLLVGIPAIIAWAGVVSVIRRRLGVPQSERRWWLRVGAVAGLCGIAVQEITDFSLQIPGVAFLFCVVLAIAIHEPPRRIPA